MGIYSNLDYYTKIKNAGNNLKNVLFEVSESQPTIPCISIEWLDDDYAGIHEQNIKQLINLIDDNVSSQIKTVLGELQEDYNRFKIKQLELFKIIEILQDNGFNVFKSLIPNGTYNVLFVYETIQEAEPLILLNSFIETKNMASGWFQDFILDYNKSLDEYLNDNYQYLSNYFNDNSKLKYGFESREDFLGNKIEEFKSNYDILNLNEVSFHMCLTGMMAAEEL